MSENADKKIKVMAVHRFSNLGLGDIDDSTDLNEALKIREVEYDAGGRIVKETEYSEDGEIGEVLIRKYNDKGNLIELEHYFEGMLSEKTIYEYNNEVLIKEELTYADGGTMITSYTYDESKNVIEKRT